MVRTRYGHDKNLDRRRGEVSGGEKRKTTEQKDQEEEEEEEEEDCFRFLCFVFFVCRCCGALCVESEEYNLPAGEKLA